MIGVALVLALGQAVFGATLPVGDVELSAQRGGFTLPNGVDVSMTVQTQTSVDGAVVLRTIFQADQGAPSFAIYTPRRGETVSGAATAPLKATTTSPVISFDRTGALQVSGESVVPSVNVAVRGAGAGDPTGALEQSDSGVTDQGMVSRISHGNVRTVELRGADFTVTHLAGGAFGSAIANTGSNRTIDTETAVSIDLSNVGPDVLGSAMLRVQDIAASASAMRGQ